MLIDAPPPPPAAHVAYAYYRRFDVTLVGSLSATWSRPIDDRPCGASTHPRLRGSGTQRIMFRSQRPTRVEIGSLNPSKLAPGVTPVGAQDTDHATFTVDRDGMGDLCQGDDVQPLPQACLGRAEASGSISFFIHYDKHYAVDVGAFGAAQRPGCPDSGDWLNLRTDQAMGPRIDRRRLALTTKPIALTARSSHDETSDGFAYHLESSWRVRLVPVKAHRGS
jgi:hypothetical protein